jgi:hypothetical protein
MTDIEAARYLFAAPARYDTRHSRPGLRSRLPAVPRGYSAVPASAASPARKRAGPGGRRSLLRSASAAGQPPKPTSNSINPSVCSAHNATCSTPTARGRSKSSGDVDGLEIAAMGRPGIGDGSRHGAIETGGGRRRFDRWGTGHGEQGLLPPQATPPGGRTVRATARAGARNGGRDSKRSRPAPCGYSTRRAPADRSPRCRRWRCGGLGCAG